MPHPPCFVEAGCVEYLSVLRVSAVNHPLTPEWRNWQTHRTQNPFKHVGNTFHRRDYVDYANYARTVTGTITGTIY